MACASTGAMLNCYSRSMKRNVWLPQTSMLCTCDHVIPGKNEYTMSEAMKGSLQIFIDGACVHARVQRSIQLNLSLKEAVKNKLY